MSYLKIFIELTRLNKPIGFMLLFWPCSWGLAYAHAINPNINLFLHYLILFFLGSVLMRSAGCIINDIVDRDFDRRVKRTQSRPIPSGKISIKLALIYSVVLCVLAFLILIQFNKLTIILGICSMFLAFSYPFMKRITYWPQLFLGVTFNWGIVMAWTAMGYSVSNEIIILYVSAIFWTLGYDTIYGAQDMSDDEIIGLKSTAIKFKKNIRLFVTINYIFTISLLVYLFKDLFGYNIFTLFFLIFFISILMQIILFKKNDKKKFLGLFKFNNFTGFLLFLSLISLNLKI